MNYKYIDREPIAGDIVLWARTKYDLTIESPYIEYNKPYLVHQVSGNFVQITDKHGTTQELGGLGRKVIQTKPGSEAKVGDKCIRISGGKYNAPTPDGTIVTVTDIDKTDLYWDDCRGNDKDQFLVLCQKPVEPELHSREYYEYWEEQFQAGINMTGIKTGRKMGQTVHPYSKYLLEHSPMYWYNNRPDWKVQFELAEKQPTKNQPQPQKEKQTMNTSDLKLLLQFMTAISQDAPTTDATNANHIAVLTEANGSYVGYIYGDTIEEFEEIIRKPENEGRKFHIFNYDTTLAQKPRKVVKVDRV